MINKALVNETEYEVSSGKTLVDGTGYDVKKGRTVYFGTERDVVIDKGPTRVSIRVHNDIAFPDGKPEQLTLAYIISCSSFRSSTLNDGHQRLNTSGVTDDDYRLTVSADPGDEFDVYLTNANEEGLTDGPNTLRLCVNGKELLFHNSRIDEYLKNKIYTFEILSGRITASQVFTGVCRLLKIEGYDSPQTYFGPSHQEINIDGDVRLISGGDT